MKPNNVNKSKTDPQANRQAEHPRTAGWRCVKPDKIDDVARPSVSTRTTEKIESLNVPCCDGRDVRESDNLDIPARPATAAHSTLVGVMIHRTKTPRYRATTTAPSYYRQRPPKSCQERRRPRPFASKINDYVVELRETKDFLQHNLWGEKESQPCAQCIQYTKGGETFFVAGDCASDQLNSQSLSLVCTTRPKSDPPSVTTLVACLPRFSLAFHILPPIESQNTNLSNIFWNWHAQAVSYLLSFQEFYQRTPRIASGAICSNGGRSVPSTLLLGCCAQIFSKAGKRVP